MLNVGSIQVRFDTQLVSDAIDLVACKLDTKVDNELVLLVVLVRLRFQVTCAFFSYDEVIVALAEFKIVKLVLDDLRPLTACVLFSGLDQVVSFE